MYQALYRKYRPTCFGEVCGQEHVTKPLLNQLKNGSVSHAYLFTGPRGTGKTSCAKILAKAVNCLSPVEGDACGVCEACRSIAAEDNLDIAEIDAASNNGVDNIRDLRNSVNYTPANSKYRVYIIDEVHMLSPGAFNALLKTLEEPPAHVIFILATTEVHKLPATIISRCQRYDFRRLDASVIEARLTEVAQKENIDLTAEAASLIAALCDGGMRDALSMLDLCSAAGTTVTDRVVQTCCAVAGNDSLFRLADRLQAKDAAGALAAADEMHRNSVDMGRLCEDLIHHFRNLMIVKTVKEPKGLLVCTAADLELYRKQAALFTTEAILFAIRLLGDTLTRMNNANRRAELEMALIKLCHPDLAETDEALVARVANLESRLNHGAAVPTAPKAAEPKREESPVEDVPTSELPADEPTVPADEPAPEAEEPGEPEELTPPEPAEAPELPPEPAAPSNGEPVRLSAWDEVLQELGRISPPLAGVLHKSEAYVKGDYLLIDAHSDAFLSLIRQDRYKETVRKAAFSVLGKEYRLGPYQSTAASSSPDILGTLTGRLSDLGIPTDEN